MRLTAAHRHEAKQQSPDAPAPAPERAGSAVEVGGGKPGLPLFLLGVSAEESAARPGILKAKLGGGAAGDERDAGRAASGGVAPLSFPHAVRIRGALRTDAPLRGVLDPEGCAARGTPAFTDGEVTHFAGESPALHVAAHEAAHQLQHAGVAHDFGLGAEGHASAVADSVAAGLPAAGLVARTGERVASARRNYTETNREGEWEGVSPGSIFARLSDSGEAFLLGVKELYATPAQITRAGDILKAKKSGISLSAGGGGRSVKAPDGSGAKSLTSVKVEIEADREKGTMSRDCRQTAREIMGQPEGSEGKVPESAVCKPGGQQEILQPAGGPFEMVAMLIFIDQRIGETPNYAALSEEEKKKVTDKAKEDFAKLPAEEKEKLKRSPVTEERAKKLGMDKYAAPAVGEAHATFRAGKPGMGEFFFHYAAVIMTPGPDSVTLEHSGGGPEQRDQNWSLHMYGPPSKSQTFHEEWTRNKQGEDWHTVLVRTGPPPPDYVAQIPTMSTGELVTLHSTSSNPDEKFYLEHELAKRTVQVTVQVATQQEWFYDRVYVLVKGGGSAESDSKALSAGESHVFAFPVMSLLPLGTSLTVSVYEWDVLSNDHIGDITWAAPFAGSGATVSGDDATYTVSLSLSGPTGAAPPP